MQKLSKRLVGHLVGLEILDHAAGGNDGTLVTCRVYGVLQELDKEKVTLLYWDCLGAGLEHNKEATTLLRKAVTRVIASTPIQKPIS